MFVLDPMVTRRGQMANLCIASTVIDWFAYCRADKPGNEIMIEYKIATFVLLITSGVLMEVVRRYRSRYAFLRETRKDNAKSEDALRTLLQESQDLAREQTAIINRALCAIGKDSATIDTVQEILHGEHSHLPALVQQ